MNPCLIAVVLAIVDSGQIPVVVECVDVNVDVCKSFAAPYEQHVVFGCLPSFVLEYTKAVACSEVMSFNFYHLSYSNDNACYSYHTPSSRVLPDYSIIF